MRSFTLILVLLAGCMTTEPFESITPERECFTQNDIYSFTVQLENEEDRNTLTTEIEEASHALEIPLSPCGYETITEEVGQLGCMEQWIYSVYHDETGIVSGTLEVEVECREKDERVYFFRIIEE